MFCDLASFVFQDLRGFENLGGLNPSLYGLKGLTMLNPLICWKS